MASACSPERPAAISNQAASKYPKVQVRQTPKSSLFSILRLHQHRVDAGVGGGPAQQLDAVHRQQLDR